MPWQALHNGCMALRSATIFTPTLLLTGFDAFAGASLNPSWLAVRSLDGEWVAGHKLVAAQLPTSFVESLQALKRLMQKHKPAMVICVGQAGGRSSLSIERIAININDASIADNAGAQPVDKPVVAGAPAAYFSTLPIKAMLRALQQESIPAEVSQTAGTFVCNHVFYGLMHMLVRQRSAKRTRGGFIHLPCLPEQGSPSMQLDTMVRGLRIAVIAALATDTDITQSAGQIS